MGMWTGKPADFNPKSVIRPKQAYCKRICLSFPHSPPPLFRHLAENLETIVDSICCIYKQVLFGMQRSLACDANKASF